MGAVCHSVQGDSSGTAGNVSTLGHTLRWYPDSEWNGTTVSKTGGTVLTLAGHGLSVSPTAVDAATSEGMAAVSDTIKATWYQPIYD